MDLYHIPNDDGCYYRMYKFVEYQHEVPSIHYRFIGEWIKKYGYTMDRAVDMCWLMSVTYNEITCIVLDSLIEQGLSIEKIWGEYKDKLDFGSARKYAKNCDWFIPLMREWKDLTQGKPLKWLLSQQKETDRETYKELQKNLRRMKYVGRFAADLFIESVTYLKDYFGLRIKEPPEINWEDGSNLTSGLYNIFYEDKKALMYEKTRTVTEKEKTVLSEYLSKVQNEIGLIYPEQDNEITMFIGKICSFRNLFKAARYGGFHHDRELGVIRNYEKSLPGLKTLYYNCYELRKQIFPERFLGEINGWDGIRKERKKLWVTKGLTGVEYDLRNCEL